jgi:glycosyltransferase involved in cell wall biosynthesis
MSVIRVAFFADILIREFDGASHTIHELIDRIDRDHFKFRFFCGTLPKHSMNHEIEKIPSLSIPFNKTYRIALPATVKKKILTSLNEFRPDVIHITTPSLLGFFAIRYAKARNIPVISIYHTHFIAYTDYYITKSKVLNTVIRKTILKLMQQFYNQCDMVYVPTTVISKELEKNGIREQLLKIWPRGINKNIFHPGQNLSAEISHVIEKDKPNILFVSRLVWEKNLKTLIRIYNEAMKSAKEYNIIVAGDGVAMDDLKMAMPNARFTGHLDRQTLAGLYAASDVFLFTSVTETYGNVVTEAMACGIPCVIAHGGGSASLVKNGVTGFLVDPDDVSGYISKIDIIVNEPDLKNQFIQSGLRYTDQLSWASLALQYFSDLKLLTSSQSVAKPLPQIGAVQPEYILNYNS